MQGYAIEVLRKDGKPYKNRVAACGWIGTQSYCKAIIAGAARDMHRPCRIVRVIITEEEVQ